MYGGARGAWREKSGWKGFRPTGTSHIMCFDKYFWVHQNFLSFGNQTSWSHVPGRGATLLLHISAIFGPKVKIKVDFRGVEYSGRTPDCFFRKPDVSAFQPVFNELGGGSTTFFWTHFCDFRAMRALKHMTLGVEKDRIRMLFTLLKRFGRTPNPAS